MASVFNGDEVPAYLSVFRKYCLGHKLINTRSVGVDREMLELSYQFVLG